MRWGEGERRGRGGRRGRREGGDQCSAMVGGSGDVCCMRLVTHSAGELLASEHWK